MSRILACRSPRTMTWAQRAACLSVLALVAFSCLSAQTQQELDSARAALTASQIAEKSARDRLAAAEASGQQDSSALAILRDQVTAATASAAAATAEVARLNTEAKKERIGSGIGMASQAIQGVSPLLSAFLPGASGVLNLLAQAIGALATAFPRKEQK